MSEHDFSQQFIDRMRNDMRDFEISARVMRYVSYNALAIAAIGSVAIIEGRDRSIGLICAGFGGLAYAGLKHAAALETDSALECLTNIGRMEMRLEEDY